MLLIALAAGIVYCNAFGGRFVYDDFPGIVNNPLIKHLPDVKAQAAALFDTGSIFIARPVTCLSLSLNFAVGKLDPFGYHLVNILLHLGVALLLFVLTRKILASAGQRSIFIPLAAALFFAVHPVNTEVVTYTYNRSASLMALFFLLSLLAFLRSVEGRWHWQAVSLVCFALSFFSKQSAIALPPVLLLYEYLFIERRDSAKHLLIRHLPYWLLALAMLGVAKYHLSSGTAYSAVAPFWSSAQDFYSGIADLSRYLLLPLVPTGLSLNHTFPRARTLLDPRFLFSIALLAAMMLAAFRLYLQRSSFTARLLLFSIGWFYLTLLPNIAFNVPFGERHLYLSAFGLYLALAWGYHDWAASGLRRAAIALLAVHLLILGSLTFARNKLYHDPFLLWQDTARQYPASFDARISLGQLYYDRRDLRNALNEYLAARRINPDSSILHLDLALVYADLGDNDKASFELERAAALDPKHVETKSQQLATTAGYLAYKRGDISTAITHYDKAVELDPFDPMARNVLGFLFGLSGDQEKASAQFKAALAADPGFAPARFNLAVDLEARKDYGGAMEEYRRVIARDPSYVRARNNLALLYLQQGHTERAIDEYRQLLAVSPHYLPARFNLSTIYRDRRNYPAALAELRMVLKDDPDNATARLRAADLQKLISQQ